MKLSHYRTAAPSSGILLTVILAFFLIMPSSSHSQVTGLSEWELFIDPGHSRTENMGLYNYSEAEKVLKVGLILREMLQEQTDIGDIYMSRTNHSQQVGLSERTSYANDTGSDFYYSIHSDAGSPSANSTLMLYGGWRENGETVEKTPKGGKKFGDIMDQVLTDAMRIGRRGNYADRTFYQGFPENHSNTWPYLYVNRTTNMASLLSEAGFHTNPTQQQRNVNDEWKRLEAQAALWTILDFHDIERPEVGIVTGFITDSQSGETLNGVTVTINEQTYTTDTYESLFHKYSDDPDEMSNGFYYLEGFESESSVEVTFTAPTHYQKTVTVEIEKQDFTFLDVELESSQAPQIVDVQAYTPVDALTPGDELRISFSRIPDPDSFEDAISFVPEADFEWSLEDDYTLVITTDSLDYETGYTLIISDKVVDLDNGNALDGNADGEPGGDYELAITTSEPDTDPPELVDSYPDADQPATEIRPIIRLIYDEPIEVGSLSRQAITLTGDDGSVNGTVQLSTVKRQAVLHFFPNEDLQHDAGYTVNVQAGLEDRFGNATDAYSFTFVTDATEIEEKVTIDDFNTGTLSGWWVPQQSGSTAGIITEMTGREPESRFVNIASGSSYSMQLNYGWDPGASTHMIRQYLSPSASQNLRFDDSYVLQAYVFGDGSNNNFRFMLRDGDNQLEGSEWFEIDWLGWKLVSWDLANDPVIGWVNGNGILTGNLYTDSFQLRWNRESGSQNGTLYIDDYQIVKYEDKDVSSEPLADIPEHVELEQNYPNPFNPTTQIGFQLPSNGEVTLEVFDMLGRRVAVLADGVKEAGQHTVTWDATSVSSGVYIYRLQTESKTLTRKMTLVK